MPGHRAGWTSFPLHSEVIVASVAISEQGPAGMAPVSSPGKLARLPGPLLFLVSAVVYAALAQYSVFMNDPVLLGAGFWPAAGLSMGLLLLLPASRWGWVLAGVAVAEIVGDLAHGYPLGGIAFWTLGNVIEPLVGALLIRRFSSPEGSLAPVRQLFGFLALGVVLAPLIGASIGTVGTTSFIGHPLGQVWPKYVVGDALGVLVMAPILLTWRLRSPRRSLLERIALGVSAPLVTFLVFHEWHVAWDVTLPYLILPFLMWAALRMGLVGAALISCAVAHIANWATATGYGPFAIAGGTEHAVTLLQVFLLISVTSALLLASLSSDLVGKSEVARRLSEQNETLREAFEEVQRSKLYIRKLEGILPICVGCKAVRSDDDETWVPLDRYLAGSEAVQLSHGYCPACLATIPGGE